MYVVIVINIILTQRAKELLNSIRDSPCCEWECVYFLCSRVCRIYASENTSTMQIYYILHVYICMYVCMMPVRVMHVIVVVVVYFLGAQLAGPSAHHHRGRLHILRWFPTFSHMYIEFWNITYILYVYVHIRMHTTESRLQKLCIAIHCFIAYIYDKVYLYVLYVPYMVVMSSLACI